MIRPSAVQSDESRAAGASRLPLLTVALRDEHDVVLARHRVRHLAELLGFDRQGQTRVATAVSELARNAFQYAGGGRVELGLEGDGRTLQCLTVRVTDTGPGIPHLEEVLDGEYVSSTGMGVGLTGARRLSDRFRIDTRPGEGTTVEIAKSLPPRARHMDTRELGQLAARLAQHQPESALEQVREQNHELMTMLTELRERQAEIERLNAELAETNRGVLALYAELDDRAEDLRRASEAKSRFLSHMSHELRAPLTSVLNLSRLLLDRSDGDLAPEQDRQVSMIKRSVETVIELVNDLLDLAKIEAGKSHVQVAEFTAAELFAALRGMLRPLLTRESVSLVFDDVAALPPLVSDEAKLSQILRNFVSNAIKFTTEGEIRVAARMVDGDNVRFSVRDTGIGIAQDDQGRVWEEFSQVEGPLHRHVKGTGLGLALTRNLAELLGGRVELESEQGVGSTFVVVVPRVLAPPATAASGSGPS